MANHPTTISETDPLLKVTTRRDGRIRRAMQAGILTLFGLSILLLAFIMYTEHYAHLYYPRTTIGGLSVAGLTRKEAQQKLNAQKLLLESQTVHFTDTANNDVALQLNDLGITIDLAGIASDAYQASHTANFWQRSKIALLSPLEPTNTSLIWQVDNGQFANTISSKIQTTSVQAKNATVNISGSQVSVVPAVAGQRVKTDALKPAVITLLSASFQSPTEPLHVPLIFSEDPPDITTAEAEDAAKQLRAWASAPIEATVENTTYEISPADILSWSIVTPHDGKLEVSLGQSAVQNSLASIAKKTDIKAIPKEINSVTGEVTKEGQDGKSLDRQTAYSDILNAVTKQPNSTVRTVSIAVNPVPAGEKKITPSFTPGLYPGKYIMVDLSSQRLTAYDGEQKFMETSVSTGKWSTPTPIGTFAINNKNPRAYSSTYGLYMPYWMSFIGSSYGLHELPEWPDGHKEGENHIGIPVSHGCIRLGVGDAKRLYDWAEVGTVVQVQA